MDQLAPVIQPPGCAFLRAPKAHCFEGKPANPTPGCVSKESDPAKWVVFSHFFDFLRPKRLTSLPLWLLTWGLEEKMITGTISPGATLVEGREPSQKRTPPALPGLNALSGSPAIFGIDGLRDFFPREFSRGVRRRDPFF